MTNTRHYAIIGLGASLTAQVLSSVCGQGNITEQGIFTAGNGFLIGIAVIDWIKARFTEAQTKKV